MLSNSYRAIFITLFIYIVFIEGFTRLYENTIIDDYGSLVDLNFGDR